MTKISKQDIFRLVDKLISLLEKILYASNKSAKWSRYVRCSHRSYARREVAQSDALPIVFKTVSSPAQTDAYDEIIQIIK